MTNLIKGIMTDIVKNFIKPALTAGGYPNLPVILQQENIEKIKTSLVIFYFDQAEIRNSHSADKKQTSETEQSITLTYGFKSTIASFSDEKTPLLPAEVLSIIASYQSADASKKSNQTYGIESFDNFRQTDTFFEDQKRILYGASVSLSFNTNITRKFLSPALCQEDYILDQSKITFNKNLKT